MYHQSQYSSLEARVYSVPQSNVYHSIASEYASFEPLQLKEYQTETFIPTYQLSNLVYQLFKPEKTYSFFPDNFLVPGKEEKFVGKASEVKEFVKETFRKMFDLPFPNDIKISILEAPDFRKVAPGKGVLGLSINRSSYGLLSEIFVLKDSLGRMMLTLGHELGHVLTPTLASSHNEEAKAYSFSFAWMEVIKKHNIAGLADALVLENPAQNGLHNIAYSFVTDLVRKGQKYWEIYLNLVEGLVSVNGSNFWH